MDRERMIAIMEEILFVDDEWGGSKLADWKYGYNVLINGIEDVADAIIAENAVLTTDAADSEDRDEVCGVVMLDYKSCQRIK